MDPKRNLVGGFLVFLALIGVACTTPATPVRPTSAPVSEGSLAGNDNSTTASDFRSPAAVPDEDTTHTASKEAAAMPSTIPTPGTESCHESGYVGNQDPISNLTPGSVPSSVWLEVYRSYPCSTDGKENAHEFLDTGDIRIADGMTQDIYELPRFDPVHIKTITWSEDPYGENYWQFIFYSLRPTRHLLYAWRSTGDEVYRLKLLQIIESFIDKGMEGPYSWDEHGAAWRTMVLVNTWWKLREANALPEDVGTKMLETLKVHGDFLADEAHYEGDYNHGVNEATALYILAVNFPDLPGSQSWLAISSRRISEGLSTVVDEGGVFVENSPFYHLYATRLYWGVNSYVKDHNLSVNGGLEEKVAQMVSYATYMLQPDLRIPTIGASQTDTLRLAGIYREMAATDPHFLYVLTQGKQGLVPPKRSVHYPDAGQTIMRSGWGPENFEEATQVIFDVGPYRTNHSDLDALSFHLYSKGIALLPDSGLYTLEPGPWRSYFHGTSAHNTVVVDGVDQEKGETEEGGAKRVVTGRFYEDSTVAYQSAQHDLYDGVIHQRAIALIEADLVLIIDNLVSDTSHSYEQKFHFFPGASLDTNGLVATATGNQPKHTVTIKQLLEEGLTLRVNRGETDPVNGFCSERYEEAVPCYSLSYTKEAATQLYITLLVIGEPDPKLASDVDREEHLVTIQTSRGNYSFNYNINSDFSGSP